jgi:BirA family biotin operon repressor/biotin-[acetyl-CoA-carboxylase] ligase
MPAPASAPVAPASCFTLTGREWDRAWVLADVLGTVESFLDRYARDGFPPLAGVYETRMLQMGRRVAFERGGRRDEGRVLGVAADGALRVEAGGGEECTLHGEAVEVIG